MTNSTHFRIVDTLTASSSTSALDGAYGIGLIEVDGRHFAVTASYESRGLQVVEFDPRTAELSAHSSIGSTEADPMLQAGRVLTTKLDGQDFVIVSARGSGSVSMYSFDPSTGLTFVDRAEHSADLPLERVFSLNLVERDGDMILLAGASRSGSIATFKVTTDGLEYQDSLPEDTTDSWSMNSFQVEGETYTFVVDHDYRYLDSSSYLNVFQLEENNSFSEVAVYALPGASYESVASGQFYGKDFLFVSNYSDSTVLTLEIMANGTLKERAVYTETQGHWDLGGIETVSVAGNDYLVGRDSVTNSVILLDVDHQGRLTQIDRISDDWILDGVRGSATFQTEDGTFVLAAARDADGVIALELSGLGGETTGGRTRDKLKGDDTADILNGAGGRDQLLGGAGNDLLIGGAGADRLIGGTGNDMLRGDNGSDLLKGGAGNDTLEGGKGDDTLDGGRGHDLVDFTGASSAVELRLGRASDNLISIEGAIGSTHDDVLRGNNERNSLFGGLGDDALSGGRGNDRLAGGNGSDTLDGGAGRDLLWGGDGGDVFVMRNETAQDRIMDIGYEDVIDLSKINGVDSMFDVTITTLSDFEARIEAGDGLVFYVEGFAADNLYEENFIF